jgi:hypothetical protein
MERNESMLIAASYFWSDTFNAFIFGHGPATPTLVDVAMLTCLDVATADDGQLFGRKAEFNVETRNIGGWLGYIQKYQKMGSVGPREHATFLNMWLDKFIFYGRSVGPTFVYLSTSKRLTDGNQFPLGRYLLGSLYHLLYQVTEKLLLGEPIGNLGGPWWFINMWLNVHMHKQFPRDNAEDYELADDESTTHSPLNYGEAVIVHPGTGSNENQIGRFFQTLYDGLSKDQQAWMSYEDPETIFPLTFHPFDNALHKDNDLMKAIITPRAIPVNSFGSGKNINTTYEFYNPSAIARQLAFGQLPIRLCYADVVKPREMITTGLEWIRVAQLQPNANTIDIDLSAWVLSLFITQLYKHWWEEWKEHLFRASTHTYRNMIDPHYEVPNNVVSSLQILKFLRSFLTLSATHPF